MTTGPGPAPRRQRSGVPVVGALMVVIVVTTIAEIAVIGWTGRLLGPWWTLGLLLASSALGAWLLRREGSRAWKALVTTFESGRLPAGELTDAALVLVGGLLLMLPGFLTDIVGLFFLIPFTRPLARRLVAAVMARSAARGGIDVDVLRAKSQPGTVIRGETVEAPAPAPAQSDPVVVKGEVQP